MTADQIPTYNLKAVIRETGLKPDTLRAWERRYGLPLPERTPGRHRLYSERDIDTLKWLIARQDEGLSISRAVALWKQLESEGKDPLQEPAYALPGRAPAPLRFPEGGALAELREAWLSACAAFSESEAEQILTYAAARFPAETVCLEILAKGLSEIGERWYGDEATVQQEHFASESAMRRLEVLVGALPPPTRPGRVLVGCAPEDEHAFPALLLTFLLKQRGWEVVYLGARVPAARMADTVASVKPHLVVLTAQHLLAAAALLDTALVLQEENVPLAYGGRIFNLHPTLKRRVPGHFLGSQIETAPQMVEQLLTTSPPAPRVEDVGKDYVAALTLFRERKTLIEADVLRQMKDSDLNTKHLSIANQFLEHSIRAALALGDIDLLGPDIAWVQGLLENHQIPHAVLSSYLEAYYRSAMMHLDDRGDILVNWLAQLN